MTAIKAENLTRIYRSSEKEEGLNGTFKALFHKNIIEKTAVSSFSFEVQEGELIGLIGPNGAGKTTLIKMLSGIIHPTSGKASVLGYDPSRPCDDFKKSYAVVMGQKSQLWWDLPAIDSFALDKEIYEIPEERFRKNVSFYSEERDTCLEPDFEAQWLEKSSYKWSFKVRREQVKQVLHTVLNSCEVDDLKLEEEDIGDVIEKIYKLGAML